MNYDILMSIKPKWFDLIASGKKTLEIRLSMPIRDFDRVWFYVSGTGQIRGRASVPQIRIFDPLEDREDWKYFEKESCVSRDEAIKYAKGRPFILGWSLAGFEAVSPALSLKDFGLRRPPMSWMYIPSVGDIAKEVRK